MTDLLEKLGIVSREGVERFIEDLIEILDGMDPDPEAEPELGAPEQFAGWRGNADQSLWAQGIDGEPWLGWPEGRPATAEMSQAGDREEVNEDGGDILDQPHDAEDDEPFLGWPETCSQWQLGFGETHAEIEADGSEAGDGAGLLFKGDGLPIGRELLRKVEALPVSPPVEPIYSEKAERMSDGTIFRTVRQVNFIPSRSAIVGPYELKDDDFDRLPWA